MKFKFLPHTGDIKFIANGNSIKEIFENSALALFKALSEKKPKENKIVKVNVNGKDLENLMYNFLEEFLFLLDSENFIGSKIKKLKIDIKKLKIECEVSGDDAKSYKISHIKAVTYSEMVLEKKGKGWIAQIVLDV